MKKSNLLNSRFGKLIVIEPFEKGIRKSGQTYTRWLCKCDCGNKKVCDANELKHNRCTSCGCESTKNRSKAQRKYNTYINCGTYYKVYDSNKKIFIIDIEDYEIIKNDYFRVMKNGYVYSQRLGLLHRYLTQCPKNKVIDHINNNKTDNRKSNLKICTQQENTRKSQNKKSISNVTGVTWDKRSNKWIARITIDKSKTIYLGSYKNIESAIISRLNAEYKYFGNFAPQKGLFANYHII